jgi:hypothetical protein
MASCSGLKITARYSKKEGPCPGGHTCDRARFNLYLGDIFIGLINLNNKLEGGDRGGDRKSELYATGDDINDYISEYGCNLKFEVLCEAGPGKCHSDITWFVVENDDGDVLLDSCALDSFTVDCCRGGGGGGGGGSSTTTSTTTRGPTTTGTTTTGTTTIKPTTTRKPTTTGTTRLPDICDPSTQPPPIIEDPIDPIMISIPSINSIRDITLINPNSPLTSDIVLTTTTSTTTTITTTSKPPTIQITTIQPCDTNCNKLKY